MSTVLLFFFLHADAHNIRTTGDSHPTSHRPSTRPDDVRVPPTVDDAATAPGRGVGRWTDGRLPLAPRVRDFVALPRRWDVEHANAWNLRPRRLVHGLDRDMTFAAAWIGLAGVRRLRRRRSGTPAATA